MQRRWQTALLVHVDNDTLKKLQSSQDALSALMNIEGFRSLNSEIQTIINHSEKVKKLKKEKGDNLTKQEKKELTEDEKKAKSLRKQVQENLLKLAARIPVFMYLTDYREQTIKDVITQIEPELFKKVTGLSVKDFDILCSIGLFDPEKMNQGIFGFRKYESSSLNYTGIDKHEGEAVGGWDTVLRREEYEMLYSKQQATVTDLTDSIAFAVETEPTTESTASDKNDTAAEKSVEIKKQEEPQIDWENILADVGVGTVVKHKMFGDGTVIKMYDKKKYINVKFQKGEKRFIFPDAFVNGFLTL